VQAAAGTHPDIHLVAKPEDRSEIPVALLIGDREHRRQEGLIHDIGLKPFMDRRKVAIIDDADFLNEEGANSLLKTLEEPPPRSLLILIGTSPAQQLPTIRSRCQIVHFHPLETAAVAELLVARQLADRSEAQAWAQRSGGSVQRAVELAEAELWGFRAALFEQLAAPRLDSVRWAPQVVAFVEAAGKEAPPRRARLRRVIGFAAEFYREMLRLRAGAAPPPDAPQDSDRTRLAQRAAAQRPRDALALSECLDRCLEAAALIERNANQNALIESWLDDLAQA
jgi:DNA polymerase-3 subunit delta'